MNINQSNTVAMSLGKMSECSTSLTHVTEGNRSKSCSVIQALSISLLVCWVCSQLCYDFVCLSCYAEYKLICAALYGVYNQTKKAFKGLLLRLLCFCLIKESTCCLQESPQHRLCIVLAPCPLSQKCLESQCPIEILKRAFDGQACLKFK